MTPARDKELETYRQEFPKLKEQAGRFVLIRGSEVLGTWSTYEDAIQAGYQSCGLNPFLVKKIEIFETIHFNSRSVDPTCRRTLTRNDKTPIARGFECRGEDLNLHDLAVART
jgi:hypothetical protein